MEKNYNYERKKLHLPEYGRHIHEMVDYLMTIEDRAMRNRQARSVIAVMGNLFPHLRDTPDYTHKLWDHLFLMADFHLDVDSPYPIPTAASLRPVPQRIEYPHNHIKFKHYGKNIQRMIRSIEQLPDAPVVDEAISNIARYMRAKSYEYNQEHPDNAVIIKDIKFMSENGINVDEDAINNIRSDYKQRFQPHPNQKKNTGRGNNQGQKNNRGGGKNNNNQRMNQGHKRN